MSLSEICGETLGAGFQWCGWYVCPTVNCLLNVRMCVGFGPNVVSTRWSEICDEALGAGFQWCGWYVCSTVNRLLNVRMCVEFRPNVCWVMGH